MGPNTNPDLYFESAALIPRIGDEFQRRHLVAPTLVELNELFGDKDNTSHPVVEPTLVARLYALSLVQRSPMGISGFDPMETFDSGGSVSAQSAPAHDTFTTTQGITVDTRVIRFTMPERNVNRDISIFGVNIYQPDGNDSEMAGPDSTVSGLLLVTDKGAATSKQKPITGETVVFAVHNKLTNDAKLYTVKIEDPEAGLVHSGSRTVEYEGEYVANAILPDGRLVVVTQLSGNMQIQADNELQAGARKLSEAKDVASLMTDEEAAAARSVASGDATGWTVR